MSEYNITKVDFAFIHMAFQRGLYYANDNGTMDNKPSGGGWKLKNQR